MSVILQNSFGYIIHPLPPTVHVHLHLIDKPYKQFFSMDNDFSSSKKKMKRKKHRTRPLNAGEVSMMTYHNGVREKILNSWKSLIELGKNIGYFPTTTNLQDDKTVANLSFPINDHIATKKSISIQVLGEGKEYILKTCLSCSYDSVDLVDICNNSLSVSKPTDSTSLDVIDGDLNQKICKIDELCGRVVVNSTKNWAIIRLSEGHFAIPNNSTFVLSDIGEFEALIDYVKCDEKKKFDCIVLDPPWENRSAIRSHKYQWLSECDLLQLPLPELCNNGCLVVVWVTNKVKFADFVREELFPSWNVEIVGEWHWIKITTSGELVFDLDSLHKKPYELLLLGRYQGVMQMLSKNCDSSDYDELSAAKKPKLSSTVKSFSDVIKVVPQHQVIVSIPSQYHSQKPYLGSVLSAYLSDNANCLEIFARNLQPGWTSWGNEVLKFQAVCV